MARWAMGIATVEHDAQFRKDLLDRLLCKKVTYQDIKRHKLSQGEMDYLHLYDILDRREYVRLVTQEGFVKQTAYNKWRRVVKEIIKDFDPKPHANLIALLKKNGEDPSVLEMWLTARCKGGIPAKDILTVRDYIVDFLGRVRDGLYERNTFRTDEAAKKLEVSIRHVKRLAKEGRLKKQGRGLLSESQLKDYQRKQAIRVADSCIDILEKLLEESELDVEFFKRFEKFRLLSEKALKVFLESKLTGKGRDVPLESKMDWKGT
ncbi:MAG: helix-turn-helix domain-containing protein [Candidatus Uhrbacteria bacterium]|nr:helix-turn-helix domain-containing protein [Candidatus Uhrbacteria bacterium]